MVGIKQLINYFNLNCEYDYKLEIKTIIKTHYTIAYKKKDKKIIINKLKKEKIDYLEIIVSDLVYFEQKIEFWF